jgi:hypothetical protein
MSRVKQPIESAKEFAAREDNAAGIEIVVAAPTGGGDNAQTSPIAAEVAATNNNSNAAPHSNSTTPVPSLTLSPSGATPKDTFINGVDGNPIAYTCERETLNRNLRDAVIDVERAAIKISSQLAHIDAPASKQALDALNPVRSAAMNEYSKIFAWPELEWSTPSQLADECGLHSDLNVVKLRSTELSSATEAFRQAPGLLDELMKPVALLRRKAEIKSALAPVSELLLRDRTITDDLIIQLHDIAQGDVFSFTRSELSHKQRELDALREDLANATSARNDALMANDVRSAETLAFREVDICEKIIERIGSRVQMIYMCDSDVKEFCDKYAKTQELSEVLLRKHDDDTKEYIAKLQQDIARLTQAKEDTTQRDVCDEEDHGKKVEDSLVSIRSVQQQQQHNWEKIMELLEFHNTLSTQRMRLVEEHLSLHAGEVARQAKVGVWLAGCDDLLEQLQQSSASATSSLQWIGQLRTYVNHLCTQTENKRIDEEAWQMRVQEQLDYLDAYKHFKTVVDDIQHRKDLRIISLQRVVRNFELQIKEATETLDPHTKKYEREISVALEEIAGAQDALAKLKQRAQEQHTKWKLIEESLEESHVDFTPPDIAAEKELCEKKATALAVARQFVNTEQETVDKDTMRLRKLKTSNVVAIEGLQKRRAERAESIAALPGDSP